MFKVTDEDIIKLESSYRSTNTILNISYDLIKNNYENQEDCVNVQNIDGITGEKVKVIELVNKNEEARLIADTVEKAIEDGIPKSEICILFRTHRQSEILKQAMELKGIPTISAGKTDMLQKREIRTVISYLSILSNIIERSGSGEQSWWDLFHYQNTLSPSDSIKIGRYLKKRRDDGISIDELMLTMIEEVSLSNEGKKIVARIIEKLKQIVSISNKALPDLILDIYEISGLNRAFTYERSIENIESLLNLKKFHEIAESYYNVHEKKLSEFIKYIEIIDSLGVSIDSSKILNVDAVRLMTIHASKGLEYELVIMSNMAEKRFPVTRTRNEPLIPKELLPDLKAEIESWGEIDEKEKAKRIKNYEKDLLLYEERRLCYVAWTRAKKKLILTYARSYNDNPDSNSESEFLKEINYREHNDIEFLTDDEDNNALKGKFARWFEEILTDLLSRPQYKELAKTNYQQEITRYHNGYFAQDKAGRWKDLNDTIASKNSEDASKAFDLIMKNKEQLLSLDEPLRFIFSHSALREGWDNPNVFQICTLNDTKSVIKKRQEIGRGLRLAVNKEGERVKEYKINRLTVVANESYEQFCKTLQSEYEDDGIEFGKVSSVAFKKLEIIQYGGNEQIGSEKSEEIFNHLIERGYLTKEGQITAKFTPEEKNFVLDIKEEYHQFRPKIMDIIKNHMITSRIEKGNKKEEKKLNKEVYLSEDFKELWKRISQKTTYSVEYKTDELIKSVIRRFKTQPKIEPAKIQIKKAGVSIEKKGVEGTLLREQIEEYGKLNYLPNVLAILDKELDHKITRHALAEIILNSERVEELLLNPHEFIKQMVHVIKTELNKLIVFGIKYEKIDNEYYEMRQLDPEINESIKNYIITKAIECDKHIYNVVEYDSEVEKQFAKRLNLREDIKLFAKLPSWFKVQTPLGTYNPDWAIVKEKDDKLYLVCETKGSLDYSQLRTTEDGKILCGKKHFEALETGVQFRVSNNADGI